MGVKWAHGLHSQCCDRWFVLWLAACHKQGSPMNNTGHHAVQEGHRQTGEDPNKVHEMIKVLENVPDKEI